MEQRKDFDLMEAEFQIFLILLAVLAGTALLARRINAAPAILLLLAGIVLAFVPGMPAIELPPDVVLLVVNLDPYAPHEGVTWLDLEALGLAADRPFEAHDELSDTTYVWHGPSNYVRLDPAVQPAHVFHLRAR